MMKAPRVAVVCDMLEEGWPSMDLVGDMLYDHLNRNHSRSARITRIRLPMKRRFSALPWFNSRWAAFNADRFVNRFWDYPSWLRRRRGEFDLFHLADHSYSHLVHELPTERTVVTCHDLDTFRCLFYPEEESRSRLFRAMAQRILDGFTKAARVICDSRPVYDQLLELEIVPRKRLVVVPIGAHPSCRAEADPSADAEAARMLGPVDDGAPLLLHVGSVIPRKRIDVLLRVFGEVRRLHPKTRLIRVGGSFMPEQERLMDQLRLTEWVTVLPFLERDALAAVYRRAAIVLQPSEREGFGLPVAEAMGCGTPVVASDIAALREVGGEAAVYCPVADAPVWIESVAALLGEREKDVRQWARRRNDCLAQAAKFSWVEHTAKVFKIYQELLA